MTCASKCVYCVMQEKFEDTKGWSEAVRRKTNNTMTKTTQWPKQHNDQNNTMTKTTQWPKEKGQKDKQRSADNCIES
jgi:hypothetical protein